jgi:hypothetical protein
MQRPRAASQPAAPTLLRPAGLASATCAHSGRSAGQEHEVCCCTERGPADTGPCVCLAPPMAYQPQHAAPLLHPRQQHQHRSHI